MDLTLTKEEAIEIAGIEIIEAVEEVNCELIGTDEHGWRAVFTAHIENETHRVTAYYYQDSDTVGIDGVEDLSDLEWEIDHYEVESPLQSLLDIPLSESVLQKLWRILETSGNFLLDGNVIRKRNK